MSNSGEGSKVVAHRPKSFDGYTLPRTDDFADLEIQCDSQSWKVHRIVICERSTVLRTALTREWKEAAENIYRIIDFDPAIVNRMIDFMYRTSYDEEEADSKDVLFHSLLANVKSKDSLGANVAMTSAVASLFIHLEMNSIADFYDVYQLRETANDKIEGILTTSWEEIIDWYPAFLEATFKKTTDVNLHTLLLDLSLPHFEELDNLVFGRRVDLDVPASFYSALLGKVKNDPASIYRNYSSYGAVIDKVLQSLYCSSCGSSHYGCVIDKPTSTYNHSGRFKLMWNPTAKTLRTRCPACSYERNI